MFLVERYWHGAGPDDVHRIAASLAAAARNGGAARHLGSTLIPGEDSIFCWFAAADRTSVAELNAAAGLRYDRLLPVVWIEPVSQT